MKLQDRLSEVKAQLRISSTDALKQERERLKDDLEEKQSGRQSTIDAARQDRQAFEGERDAAIPFNFLGISLKIPPDYAPIFTLGLIWALLSFVSVTNRRICRELRPLLANSAGARAVDLSDHIPWWVGPRDVKTVHPKFSSVLGWHKEPDRRQRVLSLF